MQKFFPCLKSEETWVGRAIKRKCTLSIYGMHGRGHFELLLEDRNLLKEHKLWWSSPGLRKLFGAAMQKNTLLAG